MISSIWNYLWGTSVTNNIDFELIEIDKSLIKDPQIEISECDEKVNPQVEISKCDEIAPPQVEIVKCDEKIKLNILKSQALAELFPSIVNLPEITTCDVDQSFKDEYIAYKSQQSDTRNNKNKNKKNHKRH